MIFILFLIIKTFIITYCFDIFLYRSNCIVAEEIVNARNYLLSHNYIHEISRNRNKTSNKQNSVSIKSSFGVKEPMLLLFFFHKRNLFIFFYCPQFRGVGTTKVFVGHLWAVNKKSNRKKETQEKTLSHRKPASFKSSFFPLTINYFLLTFVYHFSNFKHSLCHSLHGKLSEEK